MVEAVRGLVRPVVTFLVTTALVGVLVYLAIKFADAEMAKEMMVAFLAIVGTIIGFWFGSRT